MHIKYYILFALLLTRVISQGNSQNSNSNSNTATTNINSPPHECYAERDQLEIQVSELEVTIVNLNSDIVDLQALVASKLAIINNLEDENARI